MNEHRKSSYYSDPSRANRVPRARHDQDCERRLAGEIQRQMSSSNEDLIQLRERANGIRRKLNGRDDTDQVPPVVLEFAGSPKSGKTTVIEIIDHFFRRMRFKVWAPSEGASKRTPYHLRRDLVAFNTWCLNYAISELLVSYLNVDPPHLIILDRGPFDALAWMRLLKERDELTEDEYEPIEAFALHPKWRDLIARLYFFKCTPDTSLERENRSKLTLRTGTVDKQMLSGLLDQYGVLTEELALRGVLVRTIDTTTNTTARSIAYEIACEVLDTFVERLTTDSGGGGEIE